MVRDFFRNQIWLAWQHLQQNSLVSTNIGRVVNRVTCLKRHAARETLANAFHFLLFLLAEQAKISASLVHFATGKTGSRPAYGGSIIPFSAMS